MPWDSHHALVRSCRDLYRYIIPILDMSVVYGRWAGIIVYDHCVADRYKHDPSEVVSAPGQLPPMLLYA